MARAEPHQPLSDERITKRVSRRTLPDGRAVAVKRAAPNARLDRETAVLRYLHARGCAVPEVVSAGENELVTVWCGDETLDDALQRGGHVSGETLTAAVTGVTRALEAVLQVPPRAHAALSEQLDPWVAELPRTLHWLMGAEHDVLLEGVIKCAAACPPSPGSLDYTARNVLVDRGGERVWLIDFAATGFDWNERRLAQYALSAGAGHASGVFRSALTTAAVARAPDAAGVDAHEVILLLIAAEHLRQVGSGEAHPERRRAWSNLEARKRSLVALMRRPLAEDGPAAQLRAALR